MSFKPSVSMPPRSAFDNFRRDGRARMEAATLRATESSARDGLREVRDAMAGAKLGRLGLALGAGSDAQKRGRVYQQPTGFSASGWIHIRSGSERSHGAIEAYTEGADIKPRSGRYLWIPTDEIQARFKGKRMTLQTYVDEGFDKKIGPLIFARSASGTPLMIVKDVSQPSSGKKRRSRSLTKAGRARKGDFHREAIIAFYGIPRTSRAARVDVPSIARKQQQSLPRRILAELGKG